MRRRGKKSSTDITWMTSSTELHEDNHELKHAEDICCLCERNEETKKHLLTDCNATRGLLIDYMENIKDISTEKYIEFINQQEEERWLWILGGGIIPMKINRINERKNKYKNIFND